MFALDRPWWCRPYGATCACAAMLCGSMVMWPMAFDAPGGCKYVAAIATPPLLAAGTLLALPLDVALLSWTLGCEVGWELGAAFAARRAKQG